jgi:hypothetical protein
MRRAWVLAPLLVAQAAVLTEFRVFNGTEEVTVSTRLRVVPAGARGASAVDVDRRAVPLPPAVYDVQAIRTSDSGVKSIKWAERLAILYYPDEGGRHLEVINFQSGFGALQLRATRGDLPPEVIAVFETGNHTAPAGAILPGDGYVLFVGRAGRYDVRVQRAGLGGALEASWFLAIDVPAGRTRLRVVDAP